MLGWSDHAEGHPVVSILSTASISALLPADLTVALPSGHPQKQNMVCQAQIHWSNFHSCRSSHSNHQSYSRD